MSTIQFRRGTDAEAAANNPVLARGEPGWTDEGTFKIGDGSTAWNDLDQVGSATFVSTVEVAAPTGVAATDTAAIAAALASNRRVTLQAGTYVVDDVFEIADLTNLTVDGLGRATIQQTGTPPDTRVFRISGNSSDITLRNLELDGPNTATDNTAGNGAAIVIGHDESANDGKTVQRVTVEGCTIHGFRHAGVLMYGAAFGAATAQRIEHVTVRGNHIFDCQIGVFAYKNTHHLSIVANHIRDTWDSAIALDTRAASDAEATLGCSNATVVANVIDNPGVQGLSANVYGVGIKGQWDGVVVDGNTITDVCAGVANTSINAFGVWASADADSSPGSVFSITGNTIRNIDGTGTSGDGIALNDVDTATVAGNTIDGVEHYGIYGKHVTACAISGNAISNTGTGSTDYAIIITGTSSGTQSTEVSITGNTMRRGSGGSSHAVFIAQTDDVVLDRSNIYSGYTNQLSKGGGVDRLRAWLEASTSWDPASISAGTATHTDVTVTGASVGDHVTVSFTSIGTEYLTISGQVRAANTIRVVLANHATIAKDLASGTLRVLVQTVV